MANAYHEKHVTLGTTVTEHQENFHTEQVKVEKEQVQDGDDALKILHTHFEPYTKDEERRLLRKIDLRLALLMLVVNGLQFIDKLVRSRSAGPELLADLARLYLKPLPMALSKRLSSRDRSSVY